MTTTSACFNRNNYDFSKCFFILAAIIVFALVIQLNLHSILSHQGEAEAIHQCFNRNGELQLWVSRKTDGKIFRICDNGDWFGIQVLMKNLDGTYREITSFIRKTHGKPVLSLQEIEKYLKIACDAVRIVHYP